MQRLNRSTHAPIGTAFFLVLGLAILPVSLRVAGVQISFSPRLSAAMDVWQQMAEVFGASYHPSTSGDPSVVRDSEADPPTQIDNSVCSHYGFACSREPEVSKELLNEIPEACVRKASSSRRASSKAEPRTSFPAKQIASIVIATSEMKSRAVQALNALKLERETRKDLLKSIQERMFEQRLAPVLEIRNPPISKSMRVQFRSKRAAAASSEKSAECKAFSALASERRHECERAVLTDISSISPDNSEF